MGIAFQLILIGKAAKTGSKGGSIYWPLHAGVREAMKKYNLSALATIAILLGGCEFVDNALFPSVSGAPAGAEAAKPQQPAPAKTNVQTAQLDQPQPGFGTPTLVGQKVTTLRGDLTKLQEAVNQQTVRYQQLRDDLQRNAASYQATVAGITTRLQVGTTPGNPGVVQAWKTAQNQLQAVDADLDLLNLLSTDISNNSAFAGFLLQSIKASYTVSGAVEEDHRQLRLMEDQTQQTQVNVDRLLVSVNDDISRQTRFLELERGNLSTLSLGVSTGQLYNAGQLGAHAYAPVPAPIAAGAVPPAPLGIATGRPLMVIRFDRETVPYEQALFQAATQTLERMPAASFDVVAVAPAVGSPSQVALNSDRARTNANRVMRSLLQMGMPANRVTVSQVTDPAVQTNEVQIYIR